MHLNLQDFIMFSKKLFFLLDLSNGLIFGLLRWQSITTPGARHHFGFGLSEALLPFCLLGSLVLLQNLREFGISIASIILGQSPFGRSILNTFFSFPCWLQSWNKNGRRTTLCITLLTFFRISSALSFASPNLRLDEIGQSQMPGRSAFIQWHQRCLAFALSIFSTFPGAITLFTTFWTRWHRSRWHLCRPWWSFHFGTGHWNIFASPGVSFDLHPLLSILCFQHGTAAFLRLEEGRDGSRFGRRLGGHRRGGILRRYCGDLWRDAGDIGCPTLATCVLFLCVGFQLHLIQKGFKKA